MGVRLVGASGMVTGGFPVPDFLRFTEGPRSQVLHQTRFLKIEEVAEALEFYESLVDSQ